MSRIAQLYRHAAFYTFANAVEALTPIIMIPILTRYLSQHDYGLWALFQSAVAFLVPIIGLGLRDAIRMRYLQLSPDEFARYLNSITAIIVALAAAAATLGLVFHELLAQWLRLTASGILGLLAAALLYSVFYMALAVCQFAEDRRNFLILQSVQASVSIGASLALVIMDAGWKGCVFGRLTGLSAALVLIAPLLSNRYGWMKPPRLHAAYIREMLGFGLRYLPYGLFFVVIPFTNRLFIANLVSVADASLYALGESFAMMLYLLVNGFIYAWQPWLFRQLSATQGENVRSIVLSCAIFVAAAPLAGGLMSAAAWIVAPYVLGPAFQDAAPLIFWLMMAIAALGCFLLVQSFMLFKQRAGLMSLTGLAAMLLNAMFAWRLIQAHGAVGAAWASIAAYVCAALLGLVILTFIYRKRA